MMQRAVFLDRDGVLNRSEVRDGKPYAPQSLDGIELIPGVIEACKKLKENNYILIVVTNQPDVSTGKARKEDIDAIHDHMIAELPLDAVKVCYSLDKDNDPRRKPGTGMLTEAAEEFNIDLKASYMVGDRWRDIDAGAKAGCRTIFIDYDYAEDLREIPDFKAESLLQAAILILNQPDMPSS